MSLRVGMRGSGWRSVALGPEGSGLGSASIAMSISGSVSSVGSTESIGWVEVGGIEGSWFDDKTLGSGMMRLCDCVRRPILSRQK